MDTIKTPLQIAKEVQLQTQSKELFFYLEHAGTICSGVMHSLSRAGATLTFRPKYLFVRQAKVWEGFDSSLSFTFAWNIKISDKTGVTVTTEKDQLFTFSDPERKLVIQIFPSEKHIREFLRGKYPKQHFPKFPSDK